MVVSAGTVTETDPVPPVHGTVWGSPVSTGLDENTQLVAPMTSAESSTGPPARGSAVGVAVNSPMTGGGWAATVIEVEAFLVLAPMASRVNL